MMKALLVVFISLAHGGGVYKDNTEFDEKMIKLIRTKTGGDPSVLKDFIDEDGFPRSIVDPAATVQSFCLNVVEKTISDEKYSECTELSSVAQTTLDITNWSKFKVFNFSVNLLELKNVDVQLKNQQELTYLYFSSFRKCDSCHFKLSYNPALVGIRFVYLAKHKNLSEIPVHHRPKISLRGNSRLKLRNQNKFETLKRICNPELCDIQEDTECYFRYPIRHPDEYKECKFIYGDMVFNERFDVVQPTEMNFWLEGCFKFLGTGIRFVRNALRAHANCSKQHIFKDNKYMCSDHIKELKHHWGDGKIKEIFEKVKNDSQVECYQGECRGGFLGRKNKDLYSGCERVKGDLYISGKSGNLSKIVRDLSNIQEIQGQFQLINNPSITTLALPFLKMISPALSIVNMVNLENIIFHPHVSFICAGPGPKVYINKSPKIYLHKQMLKKMTAEEYVFEYFDYDTNHYTMDTITIYLIIGSVVMIMVVEVIAAARRNLLLPNFLYRLFPLDVKRRPKQKPLKKKPKAE